MTASKPDPEVPGFEVLEALGKGGLGTVYRARQTSLDRLVAIKILHPDLTTDQNAVDRFRKEWKSYAALKHANIVQVYEAGEHQGQHYFVMEYVDGSSLAEYEKSGARLDDEKAVLVAQSVAQALNYALQKAGVTHGDLKPSNIMIDADGTVKVMDFFGAGEGINPYKPAPSDTSSIQLTSVGGDIYSLGAILQRLMTGTGPGAEPPDPSSKSARLADALMRRTQGKVPETWNDVLEELKQDRQVAHATAEPDVQADSKDARTVYLARTLKPRSRPNARSNQPTSVPLVRSSQRKRSADWIGFIAVVLIVGYTGWVLWHKVLQPSDASTSTATEMVEFGDSVPDAPVGTQTNTTVVSETLGTAAPEPAAEIVSTEADENEIPASPEWAELNPSVPEEADQDAGIPKVASTPEQSPDEFTEYIQLMSSLFQQVNHRRYADASTLARRWSRANPDNANFGRIQDQLLRIEKIDRLSEQFFEHRRNLVNTSLRNGTIQSVKQDAIVIDEKRGSSNILTDLGIESLSDREFMGLLKRADKDRFPRNGMIYLLSHGQFQKSRQLLNHIPASSEDAAMLDTWLHDWESIDRNILASEALDTVESLVRRKKYARAEQAMRDAFKSYRETEVFTWLRRDETRRLNTEILQGAMAAADRPENPNPGPDASMDSGPFLTTAADLKRPPQLELKVSRVKNERQGNHRFSLHTQDVEIHVSLENKELQTGFKNLKLQIYAIAEELLQKGRYKLLLKDSDEFTIPTRGSHEYISKSVHLNFHEYANYKWGYKYYGYLCVLYDGDGNVVLTKSSKPKLKKQQNKFTKLAEGKEFTM